VIALKKRRQQLEKPCLPEGIKLSLPVDDGACRISFAKIEEAQNQRPARGSPPGRASLRVELAPLERNINVQSLLFLGFAEADCRFL
jgi:hypothetical protein